MDAVRAGATSHAHRFRWQRYRTAALVVVALGTGLLAGMASAQVGESRQREQLLAVAQAELQLASIRLELARTQMATSRQLFDIGAVTREQLAAAESELHLMEVALGRSRLNVDEIQAGAAAPRDDPAAPLVRGRDFVRERLMLAMSAAQRTLTDAERAAAETERRHRLGIVQEPPVLEARAQVARARADLELLAGTLEVRQRFLEQNLEPGDVARQVQRLELMQAMKVADLRHRFAGQRLARLRELRARAVVSAVEVLRAELEVSELALDMQRIQQQLDRIR